MFDDNETIDETMEVEEAEVESPVIPEDADISQTKQWRGVMGDLQNERSARRDLQERNRVLEEQMAEQKINADALDDGEDDELLTRAQMKQMMAQERELAAKDAAKTQKADQDKRWLDFESQARKDLNAKKMGEGLDFDTVISEGSANLRKGDWVNIQESLNPAREAYDLCVLRTDKLKQKQLSINNSRVLSEIDKKGSQATRGGSGGSVGVIDQTFEKLTQLPESELAKLLAEHGGD